jgi:hypothetical protein
MTFEEIMIRVGLVASVVYRVGILAFFGWVVWFATRAAQAEKQGSGKGAGQ